MTVIEFERLIDKITAIAGLTSEEIAVEMGYNKGYNSQIKSRNNIPEKYITALKNKYFKNDRDFLTKESMSLEEPEMPFQNPNVASLIKIIEKQQGHIDRQQALLESQQETIHFLTIGKAKKAS